MVAAMLRAQLVAVALASGCATTGALAIGPTLDGDHVVRLEGQVGCGPVMDGNNVTAVGDPNHGAIGVWSVGGRLALGAGTQLSYTQGWIGGYVEYLLLGSTSAPWGFHVGLTIARPFTSQPQVLVGVYAGPDRLASANGGDTGDGFATTFVTNGVDLSFRARVDGGGLHAGSWWQVGAAYVRRGTLIFE
jgi:hypothetical protein